MISSEEDKMETPNKFTQNAYKRINYSISRLLYNSLAAEDEHKKISFSSFIFL